MAIEPHHYDGHPFDVPDDGEPDSDDGSSDTSSILTQLGNDEFPSHFVEFEGRLFHSHGELPYPLPVDGEEQAVSSSISSMPFLLKIPMYHAATQCSAQHFA